MVRVVFAVLRPIAVLLKIAIESPARAVVKKLL